MNKAKVTGAVVSGIAAGAMIGAASYMMVGNSKKKAATMLKKSAGKALRIVGGALENASYMIK